MVSFSKTNYLPILENVLIPRTTAVGTALQALDAKNTLNDGVIKRG